MLSRDFTFSLNMWLQFVDIRRIFFDRVRIELSSFSCKGI